MTLTVSVNGTVIADAIPPSSVASQQRAQGGDVGFGGFAIDDPDALITTTGHHVVLVEESACAQPRLFTGYLTSRDTSRSEDRGMIAGADARAHDATTVDLNAVFAFRVLEGADVKRPEETMGERLTWLLAHSSLAPFIEDTGLCTYSALGMDAADYTGGTPKSVLDDLVGRSAEFYTYFAYWDVTASAAALYFGPESIGIGESTLAISNDLADIDGSTTFAPDAEAKLTRTPEEVFSEVVIVYSHGTQRLYRRRESTAIAYGLDRGTTIERPYTGKVTTAQKQAEDFLSMHAVETDTIAVAILVPPASAGLAVAGQRIDVHFTHLYPDWTSMRIVTSTVTPVDDTATLYRVELVLAMPVPTLEGCECQEGDDGVLSLGDVSWTERAAQVGPIYVPAHCSLTIDSYTWERYPDTLEEQCRINCDWQDGIVSAQLDISSYADFSLNPYNIKVIPGAPLGATPGNFTGYVYGYGVATHLPDPVDRAATSGASGMVIQNNSDDPFPIILHGENNPWSGTDEGTWSFTAYYHCGEEDTEEDLGPTPGSPVQATADPTPDDDANDGYTVGQTWVNTTTGATFTLTDPTPGAAVWTSTSTSVIALDDLTDVDAAAPDDGQVLAWDDGSSSWIAVDLPPAPSVPTAGTPALTLGTTNATGAAATFVATDATVAVFDATVPATANWGSAAATGSAATAARRDHVHGMTAAPPGEMLVADGTSGPGGISASSYVEEEDAHTTTSASLEDIPDVTTTITLQRTSHVAAWMSAQVSGSGVCVIGLAINFNGTDHDEMQFAIAGADAGVVSIVHRTATELPPGTYTVKGRMRRVSGASTPSVDRADLLVMSMGQSGPVLLTNEAEDDYLYADL